jgi:hypothetical protein
MKVRTAGAMIYLQEELSDARLRCDELKGMLARALELVNASSKRDHLYAVAGDMIYGMPQTLLKLERALEASAMAVNKIDYEELRQVIRPEKVDELERILEEVRIRMPRRTGSVPSKGTKSSPKNLEWAEATLKTVIRQESLEATTLPDAASMHAWDLGYQGLPIPDWLEFLGEAYGIDVNAEHKSGSDSKKDD